MKNKKILIIALFLILFCLLGGSKCFASVSYKNWENETVELPDLPVVEGCSNYIVVQNKNQPNYIYVYFFPDDLAFYPVVRKENNNLGLCKKGSYAFADKGTVTFYLFVVKDNKYIAQNKTSGGIGDATDMYVYACTTDIYYQEPDGTLTDELFFQVTPQVGIVAQQVEEIQLSQALQEVIAILPMTLVVLVSLVGLRKGLKMLETFLRQS